LVVFRIRDQTCLVHFKFHVRFSQHGLVVQVCVEGHLV